MVCLFEILIFAFAFSTLFGYIARLQSLGNVQQDQNIPQVLSGVSNNTNPESVGMEFAFSTIAW